MGKYKDKHGYSRFAHWIGLNGDDIGDWLNRGFVKLTGGENELSKQLNSFINQLTGAHTTGMMREQNEMQMQNIEDTYQREVSGMQTAGLNPALMYQNGASGSAPSAPSNSAGASLSDIFELISLPTRLKDLDAEIALKNSETSVNEAQARSIGINSDFNEQTFELRKQALELSNSLSREQKDLIYQRRQESIAQMHKLNEEALTEGSKRALNQATEILQRAEAFEIVQLMPYKVQLMQAQTASEKAQASLYAVNQLYQQKLVDSGYIEALCRQMEASASGQESEAVVKGITAKLRSGNTLQPADFGDSKVANVLEGLWNGVVTSGVNNGLAVVTNLLEYMPSILLAPGAPSAQVKSRTPLIYGPEGQTVSSVVR